MALKPHDSPEENGQARDDDEGPPFLGTWGRVYAAVLGVLVLLILLMVLFMKSFA